MKKFFHIIALICVLFMAPAFADIKLVSMASTGEPGTGDSYDPSISADGRYVVFSSKAYNLVGDVDYENGILVHDRESGVTKRIDAGNEMPKGHRREISISANGRFVVFSIDLIPNHLTQYVYVHDLEAGSTERVDLTLSGEPANAWSLEPSVSAQGRFVAFSSSAADLVKGDANGTGDVDIEDSDRGGDAFVRDRRTGNTERVSVSSSGAETDDLSSTPSISADGRFVAFVSRASNLVDDDSNGVNDVFIHDTETGITERTSVSSSGEQGNSYSFDPSISSDGRFVVFVSRASNLVEGDTNNLNDVFIHDRDAGITSRLNVSSDAQQSKYDMPDISPFYTQSPSISADGRYVAFESPAVNIVANDTNDSVDVFVRDRNAGVTRRLSVSSTGEQGMLKSTDPSISADGRYVVFTSQANNLLTADLNEKSQVFVVENPLMNSNE